MCDEKHIFANGMACLLARVRKCRWFWLVVVSAMQGLKRQLCIPDSLTSHEMQKDMLMMPHLQSQ